MANLLRLFIDAPLPGDAPPRLAREQAHYLLNVMRRRAGDEILLFNGRDGEWRARIAAILKRSLELEVVEQSRPRTGEPGPTLWFAPLKRARQELLLEKATELGVARLRPVLMRRSVVEKVNLARQRAILIEAAEQCGRLTIPTLDPPVGLDAVVAGAAGHPILWADEAAGYLPSHSTPAFPLTPPLSPEGRGSRSAAGTGGERSHPASALEGTEAGAGRIPSPSSSRRGRSIGQDDEHHPLPTGKRGGVRGKQGRDLPIPLLEALRDRPHADLLIGPEGGFDPEERAMLQATPGIVPVSLGPRILRAETAALAALAGWQFARRG